MFPSQIAKEKAYLRFFPQTMKRPAAAALAEPPAEAPAASAAAEAPAAEAAADDDADASMDDDAEDSQHVQRGKSWRKTSEGLAKAAKLLAPFWSDPSNFPYSEQMANGQMDCEVLKKALAMFKVVRDEIQRNMSFTEADGIMLMKKVADES